MKKSIVFILALVACQLVGYGQLNEYKYIVVPTRFEAFKQENMFQTSTLVKYLLANEGFNAVYSNKLPADLEENPCLGLKVALIDNSSLFTTKTKLALRDCNDLVIFETQEGKTKSKEFKQAYKEAISEAFGSLRGLNYVYEPKEEMEKEKSEETITVSFKNDVKSLKNEPKPVKANEGKKATAMVEPSATETIEEPIKRDKNILYAQPIEGGYQLVDVTPKVIYILKATSAPNVFMVSKDGKSGVLFKNDGKWFVELDQNGSKPKELNIKF